MNAIDFTMPQLLFLLLLALLPWIPRRRDTLTFPSAAWLPKDRIGPAINTTWYALAAITMASLIIGIAGPGKMQSQIERIGRGAELSILLDRSASMDAHVRRHQLKVGEQSRESVTKNQVVREALSWLVNQRPDNRYALTLFHVAPIHVAPFVDDPALVLAGLAASGLGRGPNKTNMGLALLAAIQQFDQRSYSGSRAILLVSDGGAKLDDTTRQKIIEGLKRNRISLYFIYIQSDANSPNLETVGTNADANLEEVALHLFFKGLESEYRVFQANDLESMSHAISQIDQLHNLPLIYYQPIPRKDYSRWFFLASLISCTLLVMLTTLRMEHL